MKGSLFLAIPLLFLSSIVACGAPVTSSPNPNISQTQDADPIQSNQTDQTSQTAPNQNTAASQAEPLSTSEPSDTSCKTWSDYQASQLSRGKRLQMPPGFDEGCVFKSGARGDSTYILHNSIGIEDITTSGVAVSMSDGGIPWFQGGELNAESFENYRSNGDVLTYYSACVTAGGQLSNCDGFPEHDPYIISNDTACYQGQCLVAPNTHAIYLLGLWDWNPELESYPTSFSAEQALDRNQYRTLPLNQLPPETSLVVRIPTELATAAFGRTTLSEGEQPTAVTEPEWNDVDDVWVVYLTNQGLADDSIGGYRYRLDFASIDGDQSKLLWVGEQQYCRRSQEWTQESNCP